jgi:hypothetical protein
VILLAAGAQAAALRIEALLPRHIAEESDAAMDRLEATMAAEAGRAQTDLAQLARHGRETGVFTAKREGGYSPAGFEGSDTIV